jgi:flagellar basal-body rod protein FlgF
MDGQPVLADGGLVTVPPTAGEVTVDASGQISTKQGILGRLRLVNFSKNASLQAAGGNLFRSDTPPDQTNASSVRILQGAVERSNVQATFEMSRLAEITRSYEMAGNLLKGTQDVDDLNKRANVPE